jgi:hypothetical protein
MGLEKSRLSRVAWQSLSENFETIPEESHGVPIQENPLSDRFR